MNCFYRKVRHAVDSGTNGAKERLAFYETAMTVLA